MKYRLYMFVPCNISEIQKGIQAGHVALEYAYTYGHTEEYKSFIINDKTWIILNGGTTRGETFSKDYFGGLGSLNEISKSLQESGIEFATFYEPDLNFALTGVCFLASEQVWDFENYPDFKDTLLEIKAYELMFGKSGFTEDNLIDKYPNQYSEWVRGLGGLNNAFLRDLIRGKKLA